MHRTNKKLFAAVTAICCLPALAGCVALGEEERSEGRAGAVYTMTNDTHANAILAFQRDRSGALTKQGVFFTGGLGSGGREPDFALANAGAVILNDDASLLFAVNPGSDDISVFGVEDDRLSLLDRHPSGGHLPISLALSGNLLYVLNAGGNLSSGNNDGFRDSINGFRVDSRGRLTSIPGSSRPLSAAVTNPAQIRFNRQGSVLVVTERVANNIDTFLVRNGGLLSDPIVYAAPVLPDPIGATNPFGFDFDSRGGLFVSDDFNDATGLAAMSSFRIGSDGKLQPASTNVQVGGESGACWVKVSADSRFAYLVNAVSSSISVFRIDPATEKVTHLSKVASPTNPTDIGITRDNKFLYALNPDETGSAPGITAYMIDPTTGALKAIPGITGLPVTVDGLAVR